MVGATAGQIFNVTTATADKILGAVPAGNGANAAVSNAFDTCSFAATAPIGSRFSITCISSTGAIAFIVHDILDGRAANTGGITLT